jgi:hypothetical protein
MKTKMLSPMPEAKEAVPPPAPARAADPADVPLFAHLVGPIAGWELHVYHPQPDGQSWLDLGNALETGRAVQTGDRIKLKASFRAPVSAALLAINPDGSVQRLAAPTGGIPDQPITELTIPTRPERYIRLTDRGPTAFLLLTSRQPMADPAGIVQGALDASAWRSARVEALWQFDGQTMAPVLKTRVAEEAVGPAPFARLCEGLKARADLTEVRAVVFEVK